MANYTEWNQRPRNTKVAIDVDQVEAKAITYGSASLDSGTSDEEIAGAMDDYAVASLEDQLEQWACDDATRESASSSIGMEVQRRERLLKGKYPFALNGNRLVYRNSRTLVYEFCLAISQAPSLVEKPFNRLPIAFERLSRDILVGFWGFGAQGYRTGWPPDDYEERPSRFEEVVAQLHERTGEWFWRPDPGMPDSAGRTKEEGLDVVVWKDVLDGRAGKLFMLCQCACGRNYDTKFFDIDADFTKITKWVSPISWVKPVRAFLTPHHIPNEADFGQVNKSAGWTFDRVRLTLLAESEACREHVVEQAREPYAELIASVIRGFEVAQPKRGRLPRTAAEGRRSRSRESGA